MRKFVMIGMIMGTIIGGYIPSIWDDSILSMTSLFFSALGGFIGIWAGYKIANSIG